MTTNPDHEAQTDAGTEIGGWFARAVDPGWFAEPPRTLVDRDEILVVGVLAEPDPPAEAADASAADAAPDGGREAAALACIAAFRERTRHDRVAIAQRAEALYGRKVSWMVRCGPLEAPFTTLSVPVMTRLRLEQRLVLDTLVAAGVARSRADALAWCVRLVGEHQGEWIAELQDAVAAVDRIRARGPV